MSTEVYLKSFQLSFISMLSSPLGNGLNNFHIFHDLNINNVIFDDRNKIIKLLNKEDASATIFKIITEYGIFTILLIFNLIKFFFTSHIHVNFKVFFLTTVASQLFLRGVGYFNSGFLIFLLLIFITKK